MRLIRSKGVGVYFISQNPVDIPDKILGQLGNRVQHALRAFSANDLKGVQTAAKTFRLNPDLDIEKAITELETGEALVSFLDEKGAPGVTERAYILPPPGKIGPVTADERGSVIKGSTIYGHYEKEIDSESAYEMLIERRNKIREESEAAKEREAAEKGKPKVRQKESIAEAVLKSAARAAASQAGRTIVRGVLGSIFGKR